MLKAGSKPIRVLIAEDSAADARLLIEALQSSEFHYKFTLVRDGDEALNHLERCGRELLAELPDLILLDLNMPRIDGREVLKRVKADERLKRIPVVVLTTSTNPDDIDACYDAQANCYLVKPNDIDRLQALLHELEKVWLGSAILPTRPLDVTETVRYR